MSRFARITPLVALLVAAVVAQGGEKPRPSVTYATSWDAAVDEAKACNLPLVVHRHGFY